MNTITSWFKQRFFSIYFFFIRISSDMGYNKSLVWIGILKALMPFYMIKHFLKFHCYLQNKRLSLLKLVSGSIIFYDIFIIFIKSRYY